MTKVYSPEDIEVTIKGRKVKPRADYSVKEPLLKTSSDWQDILCPEVVILDPDGWDRSNYDYSFHEELISKEDFYYRFSRSTVVGAL